MILYVTQDIDELCAKQSDRKDKTTIWSINAIHQHDIEMDKLCLAVDNYFTLPHTISCLRENGMGIVGTARMRKGWPPPALHETQIRD
eukprot:15347585-Ditylum_brightwellii.AAC.1